MKPDEVPNSYEDLLNPRWVGKIGIEGERRRLVRLDRQAHGREEGHSPSSASSPQMKPQMRTGHTLMAELVASGEIPLAATIYNHNAERLMVNGAPIKWKALDPTFGRPNAVAVAKRTAAPHAAHAVRRFHAVAGRAGADPQERNRVPASTAVQTEPQQVSVPHDRPGGRCWTKPRSGRSCYSELFLKGQAIQREKD